MCTRVKNPQEQKSEITSWTAPQDDYLFRHDDSGRRGRNQ